MGVLCSRSEFVYWTVSRFSSAVWGAGCSMIRLLQIEAFLLTRRLTNESHVNAKHSSALLVRASEGRLRMRARGAAS